MPRASQSSVRSLKPSSARISRVCCPDDRCRTAGCGGRAAESRCGSRLTQRTCSRMFERAEHLVVRNLRVFVQFGQATRSRKRHIFRGEPLRCFGERQLARRVGHFAAQHFEQRRTIPLTSSQCRKARILADVAATERAAHAVELVVRQRHGGRPAVAILGDVARCADRRTRIDAVALQDQIGRGIGPQERDGRIEHRQLDVLPLAALRAFEQCRRDCLEAGVGGQLVENQLIHLLGLIRMFEVDAALRGGDARIELDDRIVGAFAGARSGLTEAADRQIDELRIQRAQPFVTEPEACRSHRGGSSG